MFSEVIVKFDKRLDEVVVGLNRITELVMELFNQLEDQKTLVKTCNAKADETAKKFGACAKGFYQIRDACELLRDELSTASGTLIEQSWHNDCSNGL